jgi:zinc transport system ATP-binding protein
MSTLSTRSTLSTVTTPLVRCVGLQIGYGGKPLLPDINLEIGRGEFWAVVGRNGSGKTTWLRTVLGLVPPLGGRVERANDALRFSHAPQRTAFDDIYPLRAREVVSMGTERGWSFLTPRLREPRAVAKALVELGAKDLALRTFRSLSEGQKQRVLLARLVASAPDVAFLDEPTAAMDIVAEREALALLSELRERHGMTVVVVTHGLDVIREHADHALLLDKETGAAVAGPIEEVLARAAFFEPRAARDARETSDVRAPRSPSTARSERG